MSKKNDDDDNKFSHKWDKYLPEGFKDTAEAKSNDDVKQEMVKAETVIADLEKDMAGDTKLQVLKEDLKALMGGYRDEIKTEQAKVKYCVHLLRQRGNA